MTIGEKRMNETTNLNDRDWLQYIETLRLASQPIKIDVLLQKRMQAFIAARQSRLLERED
jgi:hypothetical protein